MKAVWSFWSKPYRAGRGSTWQCDKHHFLSWGLSLETARVHYPHTALITDREGAAIAAAIGLDFEEISTELDCLDGADPDWWSLGKMYAYRSQMEPFIHIDNDVFLWKPLPERMEAAPVLAQNPEPLNCYYDPDGLEDAIEETQGALVEEWKWYRSRGDQRQGICCGIFGGNDTDFIRYFGSTAIRIITDARNGPAWERRGKSTLLLEQYLVSCLVEYHRDRAGSPFEGVSVQYLFPSMWDAYTPEHATAAGYTHLLGHSKRNPVITQRLERRVMQDYPAFYRRCMKYLEC